MCRAGGRYAPARVMSMAASAAAVRVPKGGGRPRSKGRRPSAFQRAAARNALHAALSPYSGSLDDRPEPAAVVDKSGSRVQVPYSGSLDDRPEPASRDARPGGGRKCSGLDDRPEPVGKKQDQCE